MANVQITTVGRGASSSFLTRWGVGVFKIATATALGRCVSDRMVQREQLRASGFFMRWSMVDAQQVQMLNQDCSSPLY